jgi:hypothetical protein
VHENYTFIARGYVEDRGIGGRIILISTSEKQGEDMNYSWMRVHPMPGFCERGTQTMDYLKAGYFLSG